MTSASHCAARWYRTLILLAVRPSVFNWKMAGLRNLLTMRFDALGPCQNIGNNRWCTVRADLVSVCLASSEDRRTHGLVYEKESAV